MAALLLLVSSAAAGRRCSTLAFNLKSRLSRITPTRAVRCDSPCYQPKDIRLPLTNVFPTEARFRVVLVESSCNPLEPEAREDGPVQRAASQASVKTSDTMCGTEMDDGSEFLSRTRTVSLQPGQSEALSVLYLPFFPGSRFCAVLLVNPQVGDMVYMIKATARLPLPSPLTARATGNTVSAHSSSEAQLCVSVVQLQCQVGGVCEVMLQIPQMNVQWEEALAVWGQHCMEADEHRRRKLTGTLQSSSVRTVAAARKLLTHTLLRSLSRGKEAEYHVDVSLPQYFTLPRTVRIPVRDDAQVPWDTPADCGSVDVPLRFQADSVGQFTCEVTLRSGWDTRLYLLEALVTSQEGSMVLDFSSPAHHAVTQHIPLHNESPQTWTLRAQVLGEGFSGPDVFSVPAETRRSYPLTFHPAVQCAVMGKLSLHNAGDGTELVFTLRGEGRPPLPADHLLLRCHVGETTLTELRVPNHSRRRVTLTAVTDLPLLSGLPSLEVKPGQSAACTLAVSPWKRGKHTGFVSFLETAEKDEGNASGCYEVHFSLEIICEPAAPIRVIQVPCPARSSVAIEIPVSNPGDEMLTLDVRLEGDELTGERRLCLPPRETLLYRAAFSPLRAGTGAGSVVFQSEQVAEFWYQLELTALPPPVVARPQSCCQERVRAAGLDARSSTS